MYHYPLEFEFVVKDYLWGGTRLTKWSRPLPEAGCLAESWEVSAHPNGMSYVKNGALKGQALADVVARDPDGILGKKRRGDAFPFLVKLIDAKQNLSIQVHPDNTAAAKLDPPSLGKNELWYVVDAPENAHLICDLKAEVTPEDLRTAIAEGRCEDELLFVPVKKGQVVNIPAGTVHAITEGLLICEIQQNSDVTYRLYDYNRKDKNGQTRELHVEEAIEVIRFGAQEQHVFSGAKETLDSGNVRQHLVENIYFSVHVDHLQRLQDYCLDERFAVLSVLGGRGQLIYEDQNASEQRFSLEAFRSYLIPAALSAFRLVPDGEGLEVLVAQEPSGGEEELLKRQADLSARLQDAAETIAFSPQTMH